MVDTLTQALTELRESGAAMITVPGDRQGIAPVLTSRFTASRTGIRRSPGG
jgi:hypothetical protein